LTHVSAATSRDAFASQLVVFFVGIAWPVADAERGCRLTAFRRQWEPFVRAARLYIEEADAPLSVEKTIGRPM